MPQQLPSSISSSQLEVIISPLLASLPTASISPSPPAALLPLLSPILRQRVQLLSESSKDPWLPLLSYDGTQGDKLKEVVNKDRFEPHPVSNEVEVDWESEVEIRYQRVDGETLQSLAILAEFELATKLVYCVNDEVGGGDGWRIGEVFVIDRETSKWGFISLDQAEASFKASQSLANSGNPRGNLSRNESKQDEDDDDYWAQYDNTPAQTPGPDDAGRARSTNSNARGGRGANDEDSYYAQYADVQPAMDNHDPDEAQENGHVESTLGTEDVTSQYRTQLASQQATARHNGSEALADSHATSSGRAEERDEFVAHPRPSSSQSSGSDTVARLEKAAEEERSGRETSELGIKQHIGTSIKSLWRLAKVVGMDREEFERIVKTELDCLAMMDEDE